MRDEYGNLISGRTKLFIENSKVNEDGTFNEYNSGVAFSPNSPGTLLFVDVWVIGQIDKLLFVDGELEVKDGAKLIPPVKTERQLQIEEIERQLAALKAEMDEEVNNEDQTDAPLLDYTDEPSE